MTIISVSFLFTFVIYWLLLAYFACIPNTFPGINIMFTSFPFQLAAKTHILDQLVSVMPVCKETTVTSQSLPVTVTPHVMLDKPVT